MKICIVQFQGNEGGGSAVVHIYGEPATSLLDQRPYLSLTIGYSFRNAPPVVTADQECILFSRGNLSLYVVIGFINTSSSDKNVGDNYWPDPKQYRPKIAQMVVNMAFMSQLENLSDAIPSVLWG